MKREMQAMMDHFEKLIRNQTEEFLEKIDHIAMNNKGYGKRKFELASKDMRIERLKDIKFSSFQGMKDPEAYIKWERNIEQIFQCDNYSNVQKVQVAALQFKDYALIWWDQTIKERMRYGEPPIESWEEMKRMMRRRYAPSYYLRELHKKKVEEIESEKEKEKKREKEKQKEEKKESNKKYVERKEIVVKDVILDTCCDTNFFLNCDDFVIKQVEDKTTKDQSNAFIEIKRQKEIIVKSWHTTTLLPSSKLVCVVKCWDSSSNIQLSNISLCHEKIQAHEEEGCKLKDIFCEHEDYHSSMESKEKNDHWKTCYVHESQRKIKFTIFLNQNDNLSIVKVSCYEFYRLIFDPGGYGARNSRTNSLEEGENDVILKFYLFTR
jgi:hypothetical protein